MKNPETSPEVIHYAPLAQQIVDSIKTLDDWADAICCGVTGDPDVDRTYVRGMLGHFAESIRLGVKS